MHYMTQLYFIELLPWISYTQTVITTGSACRTLCTSGSFIVHAATYHIAAWTIITHVVLFVPSVGTLVRRKSTANFIRFGPHYLGVVTRTGTEPGDRISCDLKKTFWEQHGFGKDFQERPPQLIDAVLLMFLWLQPYCNSESFPARVRERMNTASGDIIRLLFVHHTYVPLLLSLSFSDKQWIQRRKIFLSPA